MYARARRESSEPLARQPTGQTTPSNEAIAIGSTTPDTEVVRAVGDPDTLAVALRETREESGLDVQALDNAIFDIDVHRIPARGREPAHLHFDVRFLVQAEHDRFRVSDESQALAWVPAVGLDSLTNEESVLRMARKWVTQRADGRCDASARPWPLERAKAPVTGARNGRVP